jgi:two-component system nitrogen regulation response regulator GlnG
VTGAPEIWIVDDDETIRFVLERALRRGGYAPRCFEAVGAVEEALQGSRPAAVLTDIWLPDADGLTVVDLVEEAGVTVPVIAMTAFSDLDQAVNAFQKGVFDYLPKPFDLEQVLSVVQRAAAPIGGDAAPQAAGRSEGKPRLLGESPAMQEIFRTIGRLSRSDISVLITGETGSGKEVVSRMLHQHSPRSNHPFVALNTAAIPAELLESELFGHERGSFTGAHARRIGRFEEAEGGTVFLDEIGDMPLSLQTRLLRVLAEGDFHRVGGRDLLKADVRVIAATHQDLEEKVRNGQFREDLYHRLNVIHIDLPSLRERVEDIPLLARQFLIEVASELGLEVKRLRPDTIRIMEKYHWPGNVRQLQNLCRQLCVMAPSDEVFPEDLPAEIRQVVADAKTGSAWSDHLRNWAIRKMHSGETEIIGAAQSELERVLIDCALDRTGGQRRKAAELLGIGRNTLTRKIKQISDLKTRPGGEQGTIS